MQVVLLLGAKTPSFAEGGLCYHKAMEVFGDAVKADEYGVAHPGETDVEGVVVLGYDPVIDRWLALQWDVGKAIWLVGGGREGDELFEQSAIRELREETGYVTFAKQVQLGGPVISHYYNEKKALHRRSYSYAFLFILDSSAVGSQALEAHEQFTVKWMDYDRLVTAITETGGGVEHWLAVLERAHQYVLQYQA